MLIEEAEKVMGAKEFAIFKSLVDINIEVFNTAQGLNLDMKEAMTAFTSAFATTLANITGPREAKRIVESIVELLDDMDKILSASEESEDATKH